jgi:hypothetical protein
MKCQSSKCEELAAVDVFWPGQTTKMCTRHANEAVALGRFMGFHVDIRFFEISVTPTDPVTPREGVTPK